MPALADTPKKFILQVFFKLTIMKFIKANSDGYGSSNVALTFDEEQLLYSNQENIKYRKLFHPKISKAWDIEIDKRPTLFATWEYFLFYNGNQIYYFHYDKSYRIEET